MLNIFLSANRYDIRKLACTLQSHDAPKRRCLLSAREDERAAIYEAMITFHTGMPIARSLLAHCTQRDTQSDSGSRTGPTTCLREVAKTEGEI